MDVFTSRRYSASAKPNDGDPNLSVGAHASRDRDEGVARFYISAVREYTGQIALNKTDARAVRDMLTELLEDWE